MKLALANGARRPQEQLGDLAVDVERGEAPAEYAILLGLGHGDGEGQEEGDHHDCDPDHLEWVLAEAYDEGFAGLEAVGGEGGDAGGDASLPLKPPPLPPPPGSPPGDEAPHVSFELIPRPWGAFAIAKKMPGTAGGGIHGGLQADCPFHAKK